ncbi:hypothetical protein DFP72DRAFT_1078035 [Ephemerocybe angulata]|uniref:Uncharacterized protein n=1 Tax=Ephemerocybe angulata TaxID=980116 RepID=A0A8H6HFD7_9AGAR|nr:hypothetical protein DFP72DRAFT_1078035 [Tulosesus angulatus]
MPGFQDWTANLGANTKVYPSIASRPPVNPDSPHTHARPNTSPSAVSRPFTDQDTHRPELDPLRCVSHTSGTSHNGEHRDSQNRTKRAASLGRQTNSAIRLLRIHLLAARSQIKPDFQQTHARVHRQSATAHSPPPRASTRAAPAPRATANTSLASQNRMEETRVCLRRMGLRERTDMDAHVGGYCRAQGEANIATSRRRRWCGANQDSRVCLALCRARPSRTRHPARRWANWLLRHRRCTTDDVEGGDGRLERRRMGKRIVQVTTASEVGRSLAMQDATNKVNDNHETAKTTITTTVPIRGWFAGGTETDRVWHSSISRHSFKLPSTCSAAGSPCVVLRGGLGGLNIR